MLRRRFLSSTSISVILSLSVFVFLHLRGRASASADSGLAPVLQYINSNWDVLTRSMTRCDSVVDPKLPEAAVLYLPASFPEPDSVKQLEQTCKIHVQHLPMIIRHPGKPTSLRFRHKGCCSFHIVTLYPAGVSTKCMVGTVISSFWGFCTISESTSRAEW